MTLPVVLQCFILALILGVCAYLFLGMRRELRLARTSSLRSEQQLRTQLKELSEEVETIRREMELMEQKTDPSAAVARALAPGVRIQALRMIKQGEGPERIVGALGLPRTEVDLLIKVQRLQANQPQA